MKTVTIVTAFPPSTGSLNEYGLHLVNAFAARDDIQKVIVIADKYDVDAPELNLDSKIEVRRVWKFNNLFAALHILNALRVSGSENALYNLQTCLLYTSPSPRDQRGSRMPSSA